MPPFPHSIFIVGIGAMLLAPMLSTSPTLVASQTPDQEVTQPAPALDRQAYDQKLLQLAQSATTTDNPTSGSATLWPVQAAYPNHGAILPFHRVVAYYGNFLSRGMGVLGEYTPEVVISKLQQEVQAWETADPTTPVIPAIDYIAITAQLSPGRDGKYRARMPSSEIDKALVMAKKINGLVILEVQPGLANLKSEIKSLEPYLKQPTVHLAIDPEFSMKKGGRPGSQVGTVDASDINAAADYLAQLVREYQLPPKILVVHRYTRAMLTNYQLIKPLPEVQIVIDMDGWGSAGSKFNTYNTYIKPEPVQFTGFKLFYKNDIRNAGSRLLTPTEVLKLVPQPSFIQYQ